MWCCVFFLFFFFPEKESQKHSSSRQRSSFYLVIPLEMQLLAYRNIASWLCLLVDGAHLSWFLNISFLYATQFPHLSPSLLRQKCYFFNCLSLVCLTCEPLVVGRALGRTGLCLHHDRQALSSCCFMESQHWLLYALHIKSDLCFGDTESAEIGRKSLLWLEEL